MISPRPKIGPILSFQTAIMRPFLAEILKQMGAQHVLTGISFELPGSIHERSRHLRRCTRGIADSFKNESRKLAGKSTCRITCKYACSSA
jgi:hypothetical protein